MTRTQTLFLFTTLASALAGAAGAEPTPIADEVVVVANRAPEPTSRVGAEVTVIDAGAIVERQSQTVSDLLSTTPGLTVARTGPVGAQTSVFIRGAESAQTLVVIDGIKVNDPSSPAGGYDFGNLLTGDIDRIEVLRGPQSTLWGADAIGGVVSISTRRAVRPFEADGSVEAGSFGTTSTRLGVGGADGPLSWRVAGSYFDTDGVSAFDRAFGGKEKDGFTQSALSGRASYAFTPEISLDLRALYSDGKAGIDGFPPPLYAFADTPETSRTRQLFDYTGLNVSTFGGKLMNRLAFTYGSTDRVNDNPTTLPETEFYAHGHTERGEYQGTWSIAEGTQAVFGAEHERSTIRTASPSSYSPNPMPMTAAADIDSLYGQVQSTVAPGLTLTGGGRFDSHSAFGDHTTGQAALAWVLPPQSAKGEATLVRASFGQGFKAPTLFQLYSDYGNPGLKPEKADGWDIGVEQGLLGGTAKVSAAYFGRRTRDQIDYFDCYPTLKPLCATRPYGYYDNIDRTRADGLELAAAVRPVAALSLDANYTYTRATDESPGSSNNGHELARRPKNVANASASYLWQGGLTTSVSIHYAGASFDNAANTVRLKSYTLVDLRAAYPLYKGLELYGRIENLFDQHYETAYQYGTLGRGGYIGVRARF
jgi:vitamin B12 transporter